MSSSSRKCPSIFTYIVVFSLVSVLIIIMLALSTTISSRSPLSDATKLSPESNIFNTRRQLRRVQPTAKTTQYHHQNRSLFMGIELEKTTIKIPYEIDQNLVNWDDRPQSMDHHLNKLNETPIFWHILKSGGTTIKLMYASCYQFVEACETGGWIEAIMAEEEELKRLKAEEAQLEQDSNRMQPNEKENRRLQENNDNEQDNMQQWQLWQPPETGNKPPSPQLPLRIVDSGDGRQYVNVDVTTYSGIQNAVQRGFVSSHLADVIFTPLLVESTAKLLDGRENRGRLFAMFRHPVDRVTSIFYYLQKATWEPTFDPVYATWTIDDYVNSPICESNWMVRSLVNKLEGPLDPDDVKIAREIIRKKCLVGLMHQMEESVSRFHAYFGFNNDTALACSKQQYSTKGDKAVEAAMMQNSHSHPTLDPNGETYALLAKKNTLDIVLYEHAVRMFEEQGKWMKEQKIV